MGCCVVLLKWGGVSVFCSLLCVGQGTETFLNYLNNDLAHEEFPRSPPVFCSLIRLTVGSLVVCLGFVGGFVGVFFLQGWLGFGPPLGVVVICFLGFFAFVTFFCACFSSCSRAPTEV